MNLDATGIGSKSGRIIMVDNFSSPSLVLLFPDSHVRNLIVVTEFTRIMSFHTLFVGFATNSVS